MAKVFADRIITAIDVGTTKICVLIAERLRDNTVLVIGIGKSPSDGLKKGVVVNINQTIQSIKSAVREAELMAGISVQAGYVGISGSHIHALNVHGAVPIKKGVVRTQDIQNVLAAAQAIAIPEGQQVLHVLPQFFRVDGRQFTDPQGIHGIRLEVQAHIILGATASVKDLAECCEMAGVQVLDVILEPIASAEAVLSHDEQELGAGILDIGGGTADFAIYQNGSICHTKVVPVAGTQFTRDIAIGLRTTLEDAKRIKHEYATVDLRGVPFNEEIEIEMIQGAELQKASLQMLATIVHARAHELFLLIQEDISRYDMASAMASGIVLTGGGSLLKGMKELAESVFQMPARIGRPNLLHTLPETLHNPIYATAYGLLLSAVKKQGIHAQQSLQEPITKRLFTSMRSWFSDFF